MPKGIFLLTPLIRCQVQESHYTMIYHYTVTQVLHKSQPKIFFYVVGNTNSLGKPRPFLLIYRDTATPLAKLGWQHTLSPQLTLNCSDQVTAWLEQHTKT